MLDKEETLVLIQRANKGDDSAKTILIEENKPLIKSIVKRFNNRGIEYDDLYQLGCLGFLKAIINFNPDYDVKFTTYAVPMIAGEIKRFIRDDGQIKISRAIKTLSYKIMSFIEQYRNEFSEEPTIEIISQKLNINKEDIVFALDSIKTPVSLYEKTNDDENLMLLDKIPAKNNLSDDDKILLTDIINNLPEREQKLIILRYFRDQTQSEIAAVLGVSQVQVSRLENKIIEKIKKEITE